MRTLQIDRRAGIGLVLVIILVFSWRTVWQKAVLNSAALKTVDAITSASAIPQELLQISELASEDCRANWLAGIASKSNPTQPASTAHWQRAMSCSPVYIPMLQAMFPQDQDLAAWAVQEQPESAAAYLWAGKSLTFNSDGTLMKDDGSNYSTAIGFYQRGVSLNPYDGLSWRELGDLLADTNPPAAIDAYLQSCYNGDPGSNGCWRAGNLAEKQGDIKAAIQYYRYSAWSGALDRAALLESQMAAP